MKTVREWIEFLANENYVFGVQAENGLRTPFWCYYPKEEALEKFEGYLDEIVTNAYPMNIQYDNGKIGALLIYKAV